MKHDPPQHNTDGPETVEVPAVPASAVEIFGDRLPVLRRYAELLAGSGVVRGLIGPREVPRLWERHILNCAVLTELIDPDSTVIDIGSGAGLPGLVVGIRRPDLSVTLVEPLLRRVRWLDEVIEDLALANVTVVRGRAESLWDEVAPADVVTSRAVSALENLAVWSVPMVRPGGLWLPMKGESVADEIAASRDLLTSIGVSDIEIVQCGVDILAEPTTVARLAVGTPRRLTKSGARKKPNDKKSGRSQSADHRGRNRAGQ